MEYVSSLLNAAGWATRVLYEPTMALRINIIATAVNARVQDARDDIEILESVPPAPEADPAAETTS